MHISRQLAEIIKKTKKSVLLIGPRQTGKSTLFNELKLDLVINLADDETYFQHIKNPSLLKEVVGRHKKILIDEIQRIPSMLNSVQVLIDNDKTKQFFLTGSSARKLRRGNANLLPGRVIYFELGPLTIFELGQKKFSLEKALSKGMLPGIYLDDSDDWKKSLKSYVNLYLKEEIQAEALTRDIQGFSRFFEVTLTKSGQHIDFAKYAAQAMIDRTTAKRYFDILIDTLVIDQLEPFAASGRRRLIQHPKYYCFDVGVLNAILGGWVLTADRKGMLFEHFIYQQIRSIQKSMDIEMRITTYRTENNLEVDFIIEIEKEVFAVEVKASKNVGKSDLRGLKSFSEYYNKPHQSLVLYNGENSLIVEKIEILPWQLGLKKIFSI